MDLSYFRKVNGTHNITTSKENKLNTMIQEYNKAIDKSISSFEVMINTSKARKIVFDNKEFKVLVKNEKTVNSDEFGERLISFYANSGFSRGDYLNYNDDTYIITSDIDREHDVYYKAKIQKCNQVLNIKVEDVEGEVVYNLPVIAKNQTAYNVGFYSLDKVDYGNTIAKITVGKHRVSKHIFRGMRFLFNVNTVPMAYKIGHMDQMEKGLLNFLVIEDKIKPEDDKENFIAYNGKLDILDTPTNFKIVGEDKISFGTKNTYTIEPDLLSKSDITFEIDNPSFAAVEKLDNKTCILKPLVKGEWINLKAKYGDIVVEKDIFIKK